MQRNPAAIQAFLGPIGTARINKNTSQPTLTEKNRKPIAPGKIVHGTLLASSFSQAETRVSLF